MKTAYKDIAYSRVLCTVHDDDSVSVLEMFRETSEGKVRTHRFAVFWDEDHDTRIIRVIEKLMKYQVAHAFMAFAEHEGNFTAVLTPWAANLHPAKLRKLGELVMRAIRKGLDADTWCWTFGAPVPFVCPERIPYGGVFYQGYEGPWGFLGDREREITEVADQYNLM